MFSPAIILYSSYLKVDLQAPSANAVFKRKAPFPAANIQIKISITQKMPQA